MSSLQLFPEVIDGSTLGKRPGQEIFLPIGIEGAAASDGTAVTGRVYEIARGSDADLYFGATSELARVIKHLLALGAGPIYAAMSVKAPTAVTLADRQAAWQLLEADPRVRIRMTDSLVQADHTALATSCDNANLLNNKQFAIVGMAAGTTKAALRAAGDAINHRRVVLVAPGVVDENGVTRSGLWTAASIAARVAMNRDPADDLDTETLPTLVSLEKTAAGQDIFRSLVVGGTVVNDFEDLLQDGVSPVMPGIDGGVAISHLRMTYQTDSTFDALMTRIIMDQAFIMIRDYAYRFNSLRKGNTPTTRAQLASGVEKLIADEMGTWILPITLGDGSQGYAVDVTASANERQQIISYQGRVVRGTQTILVAGNLTIAV